MLHVSPLTIPVVKLPFNAIKTPPPQIVVSSRRFRPFQKPISRKMVMFDHQDLVPTFSSAQWRSQRFVISFKKSQKALMKVPIATMRVAAKCSDLYGNFGASRNRSDARRGMGRLRNGRFQKMIGGQPPFLGLRSVGRSRQHSGNSNRRTNAPKAADRSSARCQERQSPGLS